MMVIAVTLLFIIGFSSPNEVQVTAADSGSELVLNQGDTLVVALESTPSTGYSWHVARVMENVLELSGEPEFSEQSNLIGAAGTEVLRFDAVGTGVTSLQLVYSRSWEKDVEPEREFNITVTVR